MRDYRVHQIGKIPNVTVYRDSKLSAENVLDFGFERVVLATGAQARWLDLPSEQKFKGYGVSACATCDGFFYRGKEIMVIGGGDTAMEEALHLAQTSSKVTIVHRGGSFAKASTVLRERVPHLPPHQLARWYRAGAAGGRWRALAELARSTALTLRVLDALDVVGRTSELARTFGIDFYSVLTR